MRLLLDTHLLEWAMGPSERLPAALSHCCPCIAISNWRPIRGRCG